MKLRNKFLLFAVLMHLVFIFLLLNLPEKKLFLFVAGEVLILLSVICSFWLYNGIRQPSKLISSGIEAIKDKDFNTRLVKTNHSEMDDLIHVYNQMIDQLREERIKQSEKNHVLDKLIGASPSGIILLEENDLISAINNAAVQMLQLGSTNAKGMTLSDIPGQLPLEIAKIGNGEASIITINGASIYKCQKAHFVDLGYSHYFILIEQLNDEIYKKEKTAYEKVIRIMSHETNNSIGAINSILSTVINFKDQLHQANREDYEDALNVAINRNKALSNVISNFAQVVKIPEPLLESHDLNQLLKTVHILMEAEGRKKQVNWVLELCSGELLATIDSAQIEQVLINVVKNALESVEFNGTIKLESSRNPAMLCISDNGKGIPAEVSQQLFTPFFSSKKNGQGIGLTLSREILLNHHCSFSLKTIDNWTEFKIGSFNFHAS
ncbi:sensor histidine kinase [Pedobacter metabolipauper]|uniref:histidine kinase n=1 Tax=Pedobacter metabolipauper TaxID=425513 RepID=A0A4V3D192_9SPHI|nr:ATP-binding protein [Pedobacter metabolipauper]TDQ09767.1 histidine kinase/DNA gyrase B/HSP90-like ATPase [Pedobacter metabolipauper]